MHKKLIKVASYEQLKDFADGALSMLKETNHETYEDLEMYLYKEIYGCHFCDWLLEEAVSKMVNEDGTKGGHWSVDQTTSVAKSKGVQFKSFNEYDFNYVMNMIYSDYYGVINDNVDSYFNLSMRFLDDKDSHECKAFKYYLNVVK